MTVWNRLTVVASALGWLSACGPEAIDVAAHSLPEPVAADTPHAPTAGPPTAAASFPDPLWAAMGSMDAVGPGSAAAYRDASTAFFARPDAMAILRTAYAQQPRTAVATRWRLVHLAGNQIGRENLAFLSQVARAEHDPQGDGPAASGSAQQHGSERTRDLTALSAVRSIAHGYAAGAEGYEQALLAVLHDAEPELARMAAIELFTLGQLGEEQRSVLQARGIATSFRYVRHDQPEGETP